MLWQHKCPCEGWVMIEVDEGARCPWCGESEEDQLAFEMFYLNLLEADPDNSDLNPDQF